MEYFWVQGTALYYLTAVTREGEKADSARAYLAGLRDAQLASADLIGSVLAVL